jgi:hypothetical protein
MKKSKLASKAKLQKQPEAVPQPAAAPSAATPQITTYDTINEAVHEYLLKSGLFKTVDTFRVWWFHFLHPCKIARIAVWEVNN